MTLTRRSILALMGTSLLTGTVRAAQPSAWPKQLRYAIVPNEGGGAQAAYTRLLKHLEARMGIPVVSYRVSDVASVIVALTNGQVDAARIGGEAYVIARRLGNVDAVAVEKTHEGTGYLGGLWVRADAGMSSISMTKGRRLAFSEPNSTSGYLAPMAYFLDDLKVDPKRFFSEVIFAGGAIPAALALSNRQVDVAAVSFPYVGLAVTQGMIGKGELVPVWKSNPIPNPAYVVRGALPADFRKAYQDALITFQDPEGLAELPGGVERIVTASDSNYDYVRQLEHVKQELDLKERQ
ncbi:MULTISPECIES: phosphate/phosphite/phosphonate ABC transporter substrate-binding protein [Paraburkholderia]|uniref:Phosphate/phosphite/phosphonate ABC transporter substrate-binding protein n=1 Tax=Paraburkholderia podalyriae TaxID=1938811 RepID=A0ABR7PU15_9BURK|nr:phosphate/phosphite/phosphonate ABC transporter substrate-binding protein [Paraburkholderia podalyriae]MBC8749777.1 phosphate/phosphite/phosphonate ABC transporter substrate-binding protein [Paraburkholderia podalyriae]